MGRLLGRVTAWLVRLTPGGLVAGRLAPARLFRTRPRGRTQRALSVAALLAAVLVAVGGTPGQLAGRSVLADTDLMARWGPYSDAGWAGSSTANVFLTDIFSSELPAEIVFRQGLTHGHVTQWDPYGVGGIPLAAVPNNALLSPVTIVTYLLPSRLAPAYERLAEVVVALTGCFLFLRRLKLSPPSALVGGIAFATSAFMVTWEGWPQTRVAAFIPLLFWATERFLQERRFRDTAVLGVVTAALLLGGFPSVEAYALLTVGCYALTRLIGMYGRDVIRLARVGLGLVFGFLAGLALSLFQLLPFVKFYSSWLIEGRAQSDTGHLSPAALVTSFAPWAFGGVGVRNSSDWLLSQNPVEALSYVGAGVVVLVLVAVCAARMGRGMLPRGVWVFFVAGALVWLDLIYRGGAALAVVQHVPVLRGVFGANFIGRARSVSGFLLACLAAVGVEVVVRGRRVGVGSVGGGDGGSAASGAFLGSGRYRRALWPAAVLAVVGVEAVRIVLHGRDAALTRPAAAVSVFDREVLIGLLVMAGAALCVAVAWHGHRFRVLRGPRVWGGALAALMFLIAAQGAQFVYRYSPRADPSTFYPVTDTQEYLASALGSERYAGTVQSVVQGSDSAYALRSLNGHAFMNADLAAMVRGVPGVTLSHPTMLGFSDDLAQATSPVLDRLGVAYFTASPEEQVLGTAVNALSDGSVLRLEPGAPLTAALPATGPVRAVGFVPTGYVDGLLSDPRSDSWVEVVLRDGAGQQVASAKRLTVGMRAGAEFDVPIAGDGIAAGTALTATVTLHSSVGVAALGVGNASASTSVALAEVRGGDDGLRLDYVGSTVIYRRLTALPRIRWASSAQVVPGEADRVNLLASGRLPGSTVVLNGSAAGDASAAEGRPADVAVTNDDPDTISVDVSAEGRGYLVVADADQVGWKVTVDGKPASLVPADQGVVAVSVPAGTHTVRMEYASPDGGVGGFVSGATVVVLLVGVGVETWRRRGVVGVGAGVAGGSKPVADGGGGFEPVADDAGARPPDEDADEGPERRGPGARADLTAAAENTNLPTGSTATPGSP